MNDGFIRMAAATPRIQVADCGYNRENILEVIEKALKKNSQILALPELCLSGYTCGDLFLQRTLTASVEENLLKIADFLKGKDILVVLGAPLRIQSKLYNTAVFLKDGQILGVVPKTNIPAYSEFYETRHFASGPSKPCRIKIGGQETWFGTHLLFACENIPDLVIAAEICEDLWVPDPPSISHALAGATVIVNPSASDEVTGKDIYRRELVSGQSARLVSAYIYADAGEGESSTDMVFAGHDLICENGQVLAETERFKPKKQFIYADVDMERLAAERQRLTTFRQEMDTDYIRIPFTLEEKEIPLERYIDPTPFIPGNEAERNKRCEEILSIQTMGLKKRMDHTWSNRVVIGISGGLDSTLALLVAVRAIDMKELPRSALIGVTMPCFGTTDRTYQNACTLVRCLGATLKEINIKDAVTCHFRDIGQDMDKHDVTYENSQARERTQVLMDIANQCSGLVVGTGDMSELALGWATYNGDHMSMYGVNASVPKTLVRHLVQYYSETCKDDTLTAVLQDVLATPVSPELIPPKDGEIAQKTEDLVGPYELHDFYLYYMMRFGFHPGKIYRMALIAFARKYNKHTIMKWLKVFYNRFFAQQFKRSCLPDGPKVGSVALSPRGDWRMPSDARVKQWIEELNEIEPPEI
ncbi:MAG TPA: NAD(+) synthase [Candidatus Onthocola gallistercoris]|uniref:Glutamine-dependent NAD(+) synthetase n=1 Tax=Candidatus Onthocola gallistercoris TaxID=2840876 RepID=A0A9D1HJ56_9FIRM|nr:NAD(+) synthase [Candidatus Onthocola gallistercoris]